MDDKELVERLRNCATNLHDAPWAKPTVTEAASRIAALEARQWQPIDTAPKVEGQGVLLFSPGYEPVIGRWRDDAQAFDLQDESAEMPYGLMRDPRWTPTHWMHLPEPPARQALSGEDSE